VSKEVGTEFELLSVTGQMIIGANPHRRLVRLKLAIRKGYPSVPPVCFALQPGKEDGVATRTDEYCHNNLAQTRKMKIK
jgi:hypothetical protein